VYCWGYNGSGELGNGNTTQALTPVATNFPSAPAILVGGMGNTVAYWGDYGYGVGANAYGQLGSGSAQSTNTSNVSLGFDGAGQRFISSLSIGSGHICASTVLGTVYCSGYNPNGELGNGGTTTSYTPVQVSGLGNVTSLASTYYSSCALSGDSVYCWGFNNSGQLGNGTGVQATTPVQVVGLSGAIALAAGASHMCALKNDGTMWCWGSNQNGQLGDGTQINRAVPTQVQF
jgi:alpha-tubulin suppressor-like RCC1 family protein